MIKKLTGYYYTGSEIADKINELIDTLNKLTKEEGLALSSNNENLSTGSLESFYETLKKSTLDEYKAKLKERIKNSDWDDLTDINKQYILDLIDKE